MVCNPRGLSSVLWQNKGCYSEAFICRSIARCDANLDDYVCNFYRKNCWHCLLIFTQPYVFCSEKGGKIWLPEISILNNIVKSGRFPKRTQYDSAPLNSTILNINILGPSGEIFFLACGGIK